MLPANISCNEERADKFRLWIAASRRLNKARRVSERSFEKRDLAVLRATANPMTAGEGRVDLSTCDREPIHIPGAIQPHGAMIVLAPETFELLYFSTNLADVIGYDQPIYRGLSLQKLVGADSAHDIRNAATKAGGGEIAGVELGLLVKAGSVPLDIAIHRYKDRVFVEFEHSEGGGKNAKDALDLTQMLIRRIGVETEVVSLAKAGARLVRSMLGYDRVMIYQFLHNGAGKVIAEAKKPELQSFLGQHFPASDIPYQARRLYEINAIRMIGDSAYHPVAIEPPLKAGEQPIDMSFAQLRSVSPIHCEYLQNMGVRASLSISIIVDGQLWGLISCHHDSPRVVPIPLRIGAELFGQYFSLQVSIAERRAQILASAEARTRLDKILAGLSIDETLAEGLREHLEAFGTLMDCQGVGLWIDNRWSSFGVAPGEEDALALVQYLVGEGQLRAAGSEAPKVGLWYTENLAGSTGLPIFGQAVAGALAIPLTSMPRDYLILFRSEEAHNIEWAGEPRKRVISTPQGDRLSPRGSFETWREDVRGQSRPWTESDLSVGDAVRTYLRDVFLKQNEITADERGRIDHRRRVLNDELNHRVKNIITLVKSIATQTGAHAESVADFSSSLEGRLRALAFAHDQSLSSSVDGDLATLVEAEANLHRYGPGSRRVIAGGEKVSLSNAAFGVLALVIHELMTNAAKYGALSVPDGYLEIAWRRSNSGDCEIDWKESGGPAVSEPTFHGFGSKLIQTTIVYDLGGRVEMTYAPDGLQVRLTIPANHMRFGEGDIGQTSHDSEDLSGDDTLEGSSYLVVEDQSLIALDMEELLRLHGASDVRLSPSAAHAISTLRDYQPDAAILDFNLGQGTSEAVADHLIALGIPFIFATGYADNVMIPDRLKSVPVVRKPASAVALGVKISEARRRVPANSSNDPGVAV